MHDDTRSLTITKLLKHCRNQKSRQYQEAWREFSRRYKRFIYNIVIKTCTSYRLPRLKRQGQQVVDDCVQEVMLILINNDFKALTDFRGKTESQFLGYLATISHFATSAKIKHDFKDLMVEADPQDLKSLINGVPSENRWILYEHLVTEMRGSAKTRSQNLERNVNIFMLYKWEQIPEPAIYMIPCFSDLKGTRVVQVESARLLKYLRGLLKN